jgi:ppGpp synthetase/RelA/SpoT-type nucleotidyltranferase
MEKNSTTILKEYDDNRFLFQEFGQVIENLIVSLTKNLSPHQICFRIKDRGSLANKLLRKNNKYNSLNEITDIVGLRIVTYFEDDIDKISEIFKSEFDIDFPNSIDKRNLDADKFGYRSLHYVASFNKTRLSLTEYKKFKGLKFEVQIRSILQHSWAEIEHDLGYKGANEIPITAKRTFYRVAALLEQADIEFVKLRKEISEHELIIKEQISSASSMVKIDKSAIIAFIKESSALNNIETTIQNLTNAVRSKASDSSYIASTVMERLKAQNIETVKQLEDLILINSSKTIEWSKENYFSMPEPRPESFIPGAGLLWFLNVLEGKDAKEMFIKKTVQRRKRFNPKKPNIEE